MKEKRFMLLINIAAILLPLPILVSFGWGLRESSLPVAIVRLVLLLLLLTVYYLFFSIQNFVIRVGIVSDGIEIVSFPFITIKYKWDELREMVFESGLSQILIMKVIDRNDRKINYGLSFHYAFLSRSIKREFIDELNIHGINMKGKLC